MPKAYSYIRFSRPEQMRGDSYARQLEHAEAWATGHGVEIDERLTDLGVSAFRGANSDQGALGRFLELVKGGQVDKGSILIVESLDRISRQKILPALKIVTDILEAGVKIVTLSDGYEYTEESANENPFQLIISLTILSRAHEESKVKSQRVAAAWSKKRQAARDERRPMTSRAPEWLRLVGGRYEVIEERAAVVRRIYADTIAGWGRDKIARALNAEGVDTWGKGGRKGNKGWHDSYVAKILDTPAAYGVYQPHRKVDGKRVPDGEPIPGYFPPVIDEETYWKARAATVTRRTGGGRKGRTYANLLSGLVRCGNCGGNMSYVDKGQGSKAGHVKLVCDTHLRRAANVKLGLPACDHSRRYRYLPIEMAVFFGLTGSRLKALAAREDTRRTELESRLAAKEAELATKRTTLAKWMDAFGSDAGDEVVERIKTLQADVKTLRSEAERIRKEVKQALTAPVDGSAASALMSVYREMQSAEGEQRYCIRADLAQRLRGLVERIELQDGRAVVTYRDGTSAELSEVRTSSTRQQSMEAEEELGHLEWPC